MGIRLSCTEKEVYFQVKITLRSGEKDFSKRDLKLFIKWLFVHFPNISVDSVSSLDFWDSVGRELS